MENASKALIIAGSIIVSIVLISLGVMVVNNVTGLIQSSSNMSKEEIAAFNTPFLNYEGTKSGTHARALYALIRTHNNSKIDDPSLQVALTIDGGDFKEGATQAAYDGETSIALPSNTLKAGKTYSITFATDPNSGLVTACNIQTK